MQLCEEVADGLAAKGHTIAVLTSTYCDGQEFPRTYPVYRLLCIDPDWHSRHLGAWQFFVGRRQRERQAIANLRQVLTTFRPEVIFVWHILGLPRILFKEAEQLPNLPAAYYMADYLPELPDEYIQYWHLPPIHWTAKVLKRPLIMLGLHILAGEGKPISLNYENVICVSNYVMQRLVSQGLISPNAVVIHNGIDFSQFSPGNTCNSPQFLSGRLRCLIAGRVVPDKGIHTVIEALALLRARADLKGITLTILGNGPAAYLNQLQEQVSSNHLHDIVTFRSTVPREHMPDILANHDALILPSEYQEPLARAIQEAMAIGLLVIGTTTGGSSELLVHERTGLVFEVGNPESLALQLSRALSEPELVRNLARMGQEEVIKNFNIQQTINQIESYLINLSRGQNRQ